MKTKEYVMQYDQVSEDVKFISNSIVRLKILNMLYENPKTMKELTVEAKMNYSTVSSTLHSLELRGMVYRKSNRYCLDNYIKLQMNNVLNLSVVVNLLEDIFNIIEGHVVDNIPIESVLEFHLLHGAELLESTAVNVDLVINFIEEKIAEADCVVCVLPVYYEGFNQKLNELMDRDKFVEMIVSRNILDIYEENSNVKYISSFLCENNFLLVLTHEIMILGFFKNDNSFDKNRILVSSSPDALDWANNLVKNFKKLNK